MDEPMEFLQIVLDSLPKAFKIITNFFYPSLWIFFAGFAVATALGIFWYRKQFDSMLNEAQRESIRLEQEGNTKRLNILEEATAKAEKLVSDAKTEAARIEKHYTEKKEKLARIKETVRNTEDKNVQMKEALKNAMLQARRIRRELDAAKAENREVSVRDIKKACNRILSRDGMDQA